MNKISLQDFLRRQCMIFFVAAFIIFCFFSGYSYFRGDIDIPLLGALAAVLTGLCFHVYRIQHKVSGGLQGMDQWLIQTMQQDINKHEPLNVPASLQFSELDKNANLLYQSLLTQHKLHLSHEKNRAREKGVLGTLCHELEAPSTRIAAAMMLQKTRNDPQSKGVQAQLNKVGGNIKILKEILLCMFRPPQAQTPQTVILTDMVTKAIELCTELYHNRELNIEPTFINHPQLRTQSELLKIVVTNVLRNACHYSQDGQVTITTSDHGLIVSNLCDRQILDEEHDYDWQYGFGLGLYLVENLCKQQNWPFVVTSGDQRFTVSVGFI